MRWIVSSMVLLSCGSGLEPESDPPEAVKARSYALHAAEAVGAGWRTSFAIYTTPDVYLATDVSGPLAGHHSERVVVWMPSGAAYQVLVVGFATDVPAAAGEQQAEKTASGWRVWTAFPVAGTTIEEFNITGLWSAGVSIDSSTSPNASVTFSLQ